MYIWSEVHRPTVPVGGSDRCGIVAQSEKKVNCIHWWVSDKTSHVKAGWLLKRYMTEYILSSSSNIRVARILWEVTFFRTSRQDNVTSSLPHQRFARIKVPWVLCMFSGIHASRITGPISETYLLVYRYTEAEAYICNIYIAIGWISRSRSPSTKVW